MFFFDTAYVKWKLKLIVSFWLHERIVTSIEEIKQSNWCSISYASLPGLSLLHQSAHAPASQQNHKQIYIRHTKPSIPFYSCLSINLKSSKGSSRRQFTQSDRRKDWRKHPEPIANLTIATDGRRVWLPGIMPGYPLIFLYKIPRRGLLEVFRTRIKYFVLGSLLPGKKTASIVKQIFYVKQAARISSFQSVFNNRKRFFEYAWIRSLCKELG